VEVSDFFDESLDETRAVPVAVVEGASQRAAEAISETMDRMAAGAPAQTQGQAIDLDVLAVADSRKVAVLVSDILEHAVAHGASRIHLLPYKDDFFLVYRVKGGLEKIASAPLSMQGALVDGFKQYVRLGAVPSSRPALGRMHTRIADKDVVLTTSVVPTISGQRLVVTLSALRRPRTLVELGVSDAESRALHAMVEHGRGILSCALPWQVGRALRTTRCSATRPLWARPCTRSSSRSNTRSLLSPR